MIRDPARQIADAENVVADLTDADSTAAALKGVDIDIGHTILRPNLYLQALLAFADTIAEGWFAAPIGDAAVSAMDIRDIAAAAAAVIMEPESTGRTYTLTGPGRSPISRSPMPCRPRPSGPSASRVCPPSSSRLRWPVSSRRVRSRAWWRVTPLRARRGRGGGQRRR
jgi:hypothetical protein